MYFIQNFFALGVLVDLLDTNPPWYVLLLIYIHSSLHPNISSIEIYIVRFCLNFSLDCKLLRDLFYCVALFSKDNKYLTVESLIIL